MVIWSWLAAYLALLAAAGLSTEIHSGHEIGAAFGVPPVVLFIGLGLLGVLRGRGAWLFALIWGGACIVVVYQALASILS